MCDVAAPFWGRRAEHMHLAHDSPRGRNAVLIPRTLYFPGEAHAVVVLSVLAVVLGVTIAIASGMQVDSERMPRHIDLSGDGLARSAGPTSATAYELIQDTTV